MHLQTIALLTLPLISAGIGWVTNWVAVQMLFRPRRPRRIPGFGNWQGLVPRRQAEVASQAAEIVDREILGQHLISNEIRKIDLGPHLEAGARRLIRERFAPRLQSIPLLGSLITDGAIRRLEQAAVEELKNEAAAIIENAIEEFEQTFSIRELVEDRVGNFDLEKLEEIVMRVGRREFRMIEHLGAVLGFLIGCAQLGILWAIS